MTGIQALERLHPSLPMLPGLVLTPCRKLCSEKKSETNKRRRAARCGLQQETPGENGSRDLSPSGTHRASYTRKGTKNIPSCPSPLGWVLVCHYRATFSI